MKKLQHALILALGLGFWTAQAQDLSNEEYDRKITVGGLVGYSLETAGSNGGVGWGATLGYALEPTLMAGAYYLGSSINNATFSLFGIELDYIYQYGRRPFYFGLRTGLASAGAGSTDFAIGPKIGFDHRFQGGFSFGLDVGVNFVTATNSYTYVSAMAAIKYWL